MTVPEILKARRKELGITTRKAGELIGKSAMAISNSEKLDYYGLSTETDMLDRLCAAYGIPSLMEQLKVEKGA